jgi:tetratricopeptide (TPR) repeat protein
MGAPVIADEAREALRLAEAEPERAVAISARVTAQARIERNPAAAAIAERAWGLALRHRGDVDSAIGHLREAVRLGRRAGSIELAAEARITLSFALIEGGHPRQALAEIDTAVRDLDGAAGARALTQRGTILLELGRFNEAVAAYRTAFPVLRDAGDVLWLYRLLSNRGLAHTYRHEFAPAEADLRESVRLAQQLELPLSLGFAQANLAFVLATRGDVPAALDYFDRAERRIRAHDAQIGALLQDRSELLLSVRLVAEARDTAEQALAEYEKERREIKMPEVRLLLAHAAYLDGDHAGALHHASQAAREFIRHRRPEWAALARFAALRSECAGTERSQVSVRRVEKVIADLAAAGWPAASMEARLLAARLLLERRQLAAGQAHLRQVSEARRRSGPATLRARAWYAEALLRSSTGDRRGTASAIRAGLRVLDRYRAVLGATDLRARVSGHRTDLVEIGLGLALADGNGHRRVPGSGRRVFEWAERGKASHLLQQPVRPPDDTILADALAELRATVAEINSAGGGDRTRLRQRQVTLERKVRDHARRQRGVAATRLPDPVRPAALAETLAQLGGLALLEFIQLDGYLHGASVVDGRTRLRQLGPMSQVMDLIDRIPFALHRLNRPDPDAASRAAAVALLQHAAARLNDLLLRPFVEIAERPLVVVPTGPLQGLPWSVLPSLAGRPLTVSPSATMWHTAVARSGTPSGTPAHVIVAAGPTLPGASQEAKAVAEIHHTGALIDPAATVEAVMAALNGSGVAHLATHGRLSADNPLFSDLRLSDGPLLVYDLERLERPPHTVVLAACDSARSVVYAGDELLGLSATFLAQGTTQLVASVLPILDAETAPLMVAFHRLLAGGQPPAVALASAQQLMATDEKTMAAAAGFICVGSGFSLPPLPADPSS